jgi:glycosyltransferase involved in cell wall biosynthesis
VLGRSDLASGTASAWVEPEPLESGISVVVPAFNSAGTLTELADRLRKVLPALTDKYELILVDDGSRDTTWDVISRLVAADQHVHGLALMRNFGQHNALLCGIRHARYSTTVTLDDDLQNPPEEIPKLLALIDAGADIGYGAPLREQHGLMRDLASQLVKYSMQVALGAEAGRKVSPYRAFRTDLRNAFPDFGGPYVNIDVLLSWGTTRSAATKVDHQPRVVGNSNYNLRRLFVHALNMITGFSTVPLRLATIVGFGFTLIGMLVLAFVVGRYLIFGGSVPGFSFLASMIAIFSGAQLFALGILGEYLSRMYARLMDRPSYAIRTRTMRQRST